MLFVLLIVSHLTQEIEAQGTRWRAMRMQGQNFNSGTKLNGQITYPKSQPKPRTVSSQKPKLLSAEPTAEEQEVLIFQQVNEDTSEVPLEHDALFLQSQVADVDLRAELATVRHRYPHLFQVNPECPRVLVLHGDTAGFGHSSAAIGTGIKFALQFGARFVIHDSFFNIWVHGHVLADHLPHLLNLNFPEMQVVFTEEELEQLAAQYSLSNLTVTNATDLEIAMQGCGVLVRASMANIWFCDNMFCPLRDPWTLFYFRQVLLPLFHLQHPVSPFANQTCIEVGVHFRAGDVHFRLEDPTFFATIFRLLHSAAFGFPCFHYTFYYADDSNIPTLETTAVPPQLAFLANVTPPNTTFRLHHSPSDDFIRLAMSDILVLSESSFSYAAAALSYEHAIVLCPPNKEQIWGLGNLTHTNQYRSRSDLIFLSLRGNVATKEDLVRFYERVDHLRRVARNPNFRSFSSV